MSAAPTTYYASSDSPREPARQSSHTRRGLELLGVFAAYVVAGKIGLAVPFTSGNVSPFWPPAGIALAALLVLGNRVWPAIALGAFLVNFLTGINPVAAGGIAFGNTLGPFCGAWLLRRVPDFQPSFTRVRDVLRVTVFGALCGPAISATVGVTILRLAGVHAWSGFATAQLVWCLGDAMGVLIVAPLVLTFTGVRSIQDKRRSAEFAALLLGAIIAALMVFDPRLGEVSADVFAFAVFPFVLWGAIRFEATGAATVTFLISGVAVRGMAHGFAPFIRSHALQNAMLLQAFLGVTAISGMMLAAAIAERAQLERKQSAMEALEQSEKKYRAIVETACEGIWKIDAELKTSFVNDRMAEMLGYTSREMLGRPLTDFMFESDHERKLSQLQRRRRGMAEQLETRYRRKNGSVLWARIATSPMLGPDGNFEGALAMVSDIGEEKRAEAEASRSQRTIQLLSQAIEQTADSVVITDCNGLIEYVNPAFEATTGYGRAEVIGRTPRILKSGVHDQMIYQRLWKQVLAGETFRGTLANRKKSGECYWTEQTITSIRDAAGEITHFVSVHKDLTELSPAGRAGVAVAAGARGAAAFLCEHSAVGSGL